MHKDTIGQTEFIFRRVDSPDLLEEVFRLRYQVYCKECNFIKEEDYPDSIEKDKYDPHSVHFVAEDPYGIIGTVRLILDSPYKFPFEEHCNDKLTVDIDSLPRGKAAEVSRLVISKNYRRRTDDGLYYTPDFNDKVTGVDIADITKRIRPIAFGIYREIYQECKRRGITHWFAIMEKSLWRLLYMHSFIFKPIGEEVDFYGMVTPYLASIEEIERAFYKKSPQFAAEYFFDGLEPQYRSSFIANL